MRKRGRLSSAFFPPGRAKRVEQALVLGCQAALFFQPGKDRQGFAQRFGRIRRLEGGDTVKRVYYESHAQLRRHLVDFVAAYNFGRRLKTLKGLTPHEFICKQWTSQPQRFTFNPLQQMPGPNI